MEAIDKFVFDICSKCGDNTAILKENHLCTKCGGTAMRKPGK